MISTPPGCGPTTLTNNPASANSPAILASSWPPGKPRNGRPAARQHGHRRMLAAVPAPAAASHGWDGRTTSSSRLNPGHVFCGKRARIGLMTAMLALGLWTVNPIFESPVDLRCVFKSKPGLTIRNWPERTVGQRRQDRCRCPRPRAVPPRMKNGTSAPRSAPSCSRSAGSRPVPNRRLQATRTAAASLLPPPRPAPVGISLCRDSRSRPETFSSRQNRRAARQHRLVSSAGIAAHRPVHLQGDLRLAAQPLFVQRHVQTRRTAAPPAGWSRSHGSRRDGGAAPPGGDSPWPVRAGADVCRPAAGRPRTRRLRPVAASSDCLSVRANGRRPGPQVFVQVARQGTAGSADRADRRAATTGATDGPRHAARPGRKVAVRARRSQEPAGRCARSGACRPDRRRPARGRRNAAARAHRGIHARPAAAPRRRPPPDRCRRCTTWRATTRPCGPTCQTVRRARRRGREQLAQQPRRYRPGSRRRARRGGSGARPAPAGPTWRSAPSRRQGDTRSASPERQNRLVTQGKRHRRRRPGRFQRGQSAARGRTGTGAPRTAAASRTKSVRRRSSHAWSARPAPPGRRPRRRPGSGRPSGRRVTVPVGAVRRRRLRPAQASTPSTCQGGQVRPGCQCAPSTAATSDHGAGGGTAGPARPGPAPAGNPRSRFQAELRPGQQPVA